MSFAKSMLRLCLSMLVATDLRYRICFHDQTVGCLFDYCENRSDIVVGLRKMRFDHDICRNAIKDEDQLNAIDKLIALKVPPI